MCIHAIARLAIVDASDRTHVCLFVCCIVSKRRELGSQNLYYRLLQRLQFSDPVKCLLKFERKSAPPLAP